MTVPGNLSSPLLATAAEAAAAADVATKSLRFNSGDSAHLNRTPSSAGNRKKWTWSGWVKRSKSGHSDFFSAVQDVNNATIIQFDNNDRLDFEDYQTSNVGRRITTAVFRDFSAWYHICCVYDSDNSTADDRVKLFVNGTELTDFDSTNNPSSGHNTLINSANAHYVGVDKGFSNHFFNGYLADVYLIDGAAVEPVDNFIELDDNGVYQARAYSGTFGTNGFHLSFSDTSSNAALGTDSSGNDNDFTVNNLVASAPATAKGGFDIVTYTGTGSSQSLSLSFQPDLIWVKTRSHSVDHKLVDSVRGLTKVQEPNNARVDATDSNGITATSATGFTVGTSSDFNTSSRTYVAWCWKAGGTAVSNTDGSITSSVSASTDYGFSIVSYTGTGSNATVGHGLNSAVKWLLVKSRGTTQSWQTFHVSVGNTKSMHLNTTDTPDTASSYWQDTDPTSSVFSVGSSNSVNQSSTEYIAYCWSEVSGFSSFGSYEGDGDGTGPDVTTGFKPRFVIIKNIDEAAGWRIYDSDRGTSAVLRTNLSTNEFTTSDPIVFLSDGFRLTGTTNEETNKSGMTYIYAAFSGEPPGDLVDSLFDAPTNGSQSDTGAGGEVSGNYVTLNPLDSTLGSNLTNGNLDAAGSSSWSAAHARGTFGLTSGKWYWEVTRTGGSGANAMIGFGNKAFSLTESFSSTPANGWLFNFANGTEILRPSGGGSGYFSGSAMGVDDTVGIALDMDNKTAVFYKNGTAGASIDLSSTKTSSTDNIDELFPLVGVYNANVTFNGGQRAWAYSAPSNHKALCTTNLPDPTIADGSTAMDIALYNGNGGTQSVSGLNLAPDWVWIKNRNGGHNHMLFDIVRGAGADLQSNSTATEGAAGSNDLTSFDSSGFSLGSNNAVNQSGRTFVAWAWDAGSSTSSNTDGSITSNVRANASAGFSIVTYTGSANGTVGHGLNAAPEFIFAKSRTVTKGWICYHKALGKDKYLVLNGTNTAQSSSGVWGSAEPTSSVFGLENSSTGGNTDGDLVAYCISPVAGYSAVGSYEGNGSSDGTFVYTGFRPAFVLIKNSSAAANWMLYDTARNPFNEAPYVLGPNNSDGGLTYDAYSGSYPIDILSNGFKPRTNLSNVNGNGNTLVYLCFAENPFQANGGLAR